MKFTTWERLFLLVVLGQEKGTKEHIEKVLSIIKALDLTPDEASKINFKNKNGVIEWSEEESTIWEIDITKDKLLNVIFPILDKYDKWTPNDLETIYKMRDRLL